MEKGLTKSTYGAHVLSCFIVSTLLTPHSVQYVHTIYCTVVPASTGNLLFCCSILQSFWNQIHTFISPLIHSLPLIHCLLLHMTMSWQYRVFELYLPKIAACFSIIGSSLILAELVQDWRQRLKRQLRHGQRRGLGAIARVLFSMSVGDLFFSLYDTVLCMNHVSFLPFALFSSTTSLSSPRPSTFFKFCLEIHLLRLPCPPFPRLAVGGSWRAG
jgi:hypothetical protein